MEYDIETVVFDDALYHPVELTIPLPEIDLSIQAKLSGKTSVEVRFISNRSTSVQNPSWPKGIITLSH